MSKLRRRPLNPWGDGSGELDFPEYPLPSVAEDYRSEIEATLEPFEYDLQPPDDALVRPAGLDRRIVRDFSLRERTRNCLAAARCHEGSGEVTVGEILRLQGFGPVSLHDLLFATCKFLFVCAAREEDDPLRHPRAPAPRDTAPSPPPPAGWERAENARRPVLAAAGELLGAKTLAEVLNPRTLRLASHIGVAPELAAVPVKELLEGRPGLAAVVVRRLRELLEGMEPRELAVVEGRIVAGSPKRTLEEIAQKFGVTRERARQIEVELARRFAEAGGGELRVVATFLKEEFGDLAAEGKANHRIEGLLPEDLGPAPELVRSVFRKTLLDEMGFLPYDGAWLDERAVETLDRIRESVCELADDVGLVDEEEATEQLPGVEWRRMWPWIRARCGLLESHGSLGLRDSDKARAKAGLIALGRPSPVAEIANICGFNKNKTRSHLSVIPSVVKADKERWALREWIAEEYHGIVGGIARRIEEDGGATPVARLLRELPRKFGVSPASVRQFMRAPKFEVSGDWIRLRSKLAIRLRKLDEVIDGRDVSGAPFWSFPVEDRYFAGYSVPRVPPEFARALGCAPDSGERVRIANLPDCGELSVRWPLGSNNGGSIGYLSEPLRRLGAEPGQRVRVTIRAPRLVELSVESDRVETKAVPPGLFASKGRLP